MVVDPASFCSDFGTKSFYEHGCILYYARKLPS